MGRRWRVVLATLCVEAVAAVAVLVSGPLSLVAVAVVYWIDLAFVIARVVTGQLVGAETTVLQLPRALPQFRLLTHKRGTLTLSDRLPPMYLRSLPTVLFSLSILAASALGTAVVLTVSVPEQFWNDPRTPFVLAAGGIAAATKSWLLYTDHLDRRGTENARSSEFVAGKRQLVLLLYAPLVYLVAEITTTALAAPAVENTVLFVVSVLILSRLAYGIRVSRHPANSGELVGRTESIGSDDDPPSTPAPPSTPDGRPLETAEPTARAVPAAGLVNTLTAGGVVDGQFSEPGLSLRVLGTLFVVLPGILAALDGSSIFRIFLAGVFLSGVGFWLLSTLHMELAFGEIEYRFYESAVVAYDRRLAEPQWAIPYDSIETVSVERGLFGSPAWLDAGTVRVSLIDGTAPAPDNQERATILFVPDPETVSDWIGARRRDGRRDR
jgi:hypothetical protein